VSEFDPNVTIFPNYQTLALPPMSSVLTAIKDEMIHYEVPPNDKKLIYDEAMEELNDLCSKIPFKDVTSLKFHTNSWGMSCSKHFGEKYLSQCVNLTRMDLSDTIKFKPRSDLCMSTAAMLEYCKEFKITHIYLQDNLLEADGAKAFNEFLWQNSHLKTLNLTNCKLGKRSAELLLEAWEENKAL
jgi:hypothetical protein